MTPSALAKKMIPQEFLYFGSFFNVEICPLPLHGEAKDSRKTLIFRIIFNVEI
jgi:hypothetical protein